MAGQSDEVLRVFAGAQDTFGRHVREAASAGLWPEPTPCTEWNVRDLVNHLTVEQLWVPEMLAGRTVAEVGDRFDGDVLGADPAGAWEAAAAAARAAFAEPGAMERTVQLSYGPRPAVEYCREMIVDGVVHAWDLAVGVGGDRAMDPEAAEFALAAVAPIADALASSGMFGPPVAVPADAGPQSRLLALLGRDPADPMRAAG
ncbi:TIGR03086 family metal-binding protein [Kitasatospora sp. NPDC059571]|uniref:TIGR03086 family metal-binding protein n=1 Tax=Kitasatospora sp. NPDC059571 TaxID=3346871 RepID=UPI003691E6DA